MASEKTAFEQGQLAYKLNPNRLKNPYEPGSDEYNDFERGWVQKLKRSPNPTPTNPPVPPRHYRYTGKQDQQVSKEDVEKSVSRRYRDLKG